MGVRKALNAAGVTLLLLWVLFGGTRLVLTAADTWREAEVSAASPTLSETQRLRAENHRLKVALWTQKRQLLDAEGQQLSQEQGTLEAEFAKALGAAPGQTFNWSTFALNPAPAPAPPQP